MVDTTRQPALALDAVEFIGPAVKRPECVVVTASGDVFASDGRGGVSHHQPDGTCRVILARDPGFELIPNGIALLRDRSLLLANISPHGGVWSLTLDGALSPFLLEVEGERIPQTNFVGIDDADRTWITVSTRHVPMATGAVKGVADGYVVLVDRRGARVVADGLGFTNEAKVDPSGQWLYVNETVGQRMSRYRILSGGSLGPRETVSEFAAGSFPDGLAFDAEGQVWMTCVISNEVIRVDPRSGRQAVVLQERNEAHIDAIVSIFDTGAFAGWAAAPGSILENPTSITFGGLELHYAYLGFLQGRRLARFRTAVAGAVPPHWHF